MADKNVQDKIPNSPIEKYYYNKGYFKGYIKQILFQKLLDILDKHFQIQVNY